MKTSIIIELAFRIIALLASLGAWIYMFMNHGGIAIALFIILGSENLNTHYKIERSTTLKAIFKSK